MVKSVNAADGDEGKFERELWALLFEHFQAERRRWSDTCNQFGLTLPQAHLLRMLTVGKPVKMNGLAEALDCDASNITGLVDKLEVRGLIKRQADTEDRRVKMIAITRAGINFRLKLWAQLSQPSPSVTSLRLSDKKNLYRIVKRMVATAADGRAREVR